MVNYHQIEAVHIQGFRSLADVQLDNLPGLVALIGANGSGKSNFIRFFEMMSWMLRSRKLGEFVQRQGGADDQLFGGGRRTPRLEASLTMHAWDNPDEYKFTLVHGNPDRFIFTEEAFRRSPSDFSDEEDWRHLGSAHTEAEIVAAQSAEFADVEKETAREIVAFMSGCTVFHFQDTSDGARFKTAWDMHDFGHLRPDGGNLAAVLFWLDIEYHHIFETICRQIGRVLPLFDRFELEDIYDKVQLRWKARWTDKTFGAHVTSDGSLRLFALTTLLNLPDEMLPNVILLDEPELGLHPAAVALVGEMINALSQQTQIIVATQSPLLIDSFRLDQIVVFDLEDGRTNARQLDMTQYERWLNDFTTGELWQKGLLGGRP